MVAFANPLIDSVNQVINESNNLTPIDFATIAAVFLAGLIILLIFAFILGHVNMPISFYMDNRGQGAMEYLMSYGWAILVVMVVGLILWQLGVFNAGQGGPVETGFVRVNPMMPSVAYKGTNFNATFTNDAGSPIRVISVSLNETISGGSCGTVTPSSSNVLSGEVFSVSGTGCTSVPTGAVYNMMVVMTYKATTSAITATHTENGYIRGLAE